jgi:hypothetical protein
MAVSRFFSAARPLDITAHIFLPFGFSFLSDLKGSCYMAASPVFALPYVSAGSFSALCASFSVSWSLTVCNGTASPIFVSLFPGTAPNRAVPFIS